MYTVGMSLVKGLHASCTGRVLFRNVPNHRNDTTHFLSILIGKRITLYDRSSKPQTNLFC